MSSLVEPLADWADWEEPDVAQTSNIVNLDALIRRADLASPGGDAGDTLALTIQGLERSGFFYPALRKPDFQRETASWSPEQVTDLVLTFARNDLIPAVILWRSGQNVFVIDGAHRLSALIAWVHDDYGDGAISQAFFNNDISTAQREAAQRTRNILKNEIGTWQDHKNAIEYPQSARDDIKERAIRIGWQNIYVQWILRADHEKAETSFFRINQGGTKIDPTEQRILRARRSATAISARAILRAGAGHNYWEGFSPEAQSRISTLGKEIFDLLYRPTLIYPVKTLDVPVAGAGYGSHVLPLLFDLVNITNNLQVADSSNRRGSKDQELIADLDGSQSIKYLTRTRDVIQRICSNHSSSLGLHPALYFYTRRGVFQPAALLSFVSFFKDFTTEQYKDFSKVRQGFESFLLQNRTITEAIRTLGSGARSRPRVLRLYRTVISKLQAGLSLEAIRSEIEQDAALSLFIKADEEPASQEESKLGQKLSRDVKGAAFLRDALPIAPKCPTCGGVMHRNGMQAGHIVARRDGGQNQYENAQMQHPFCNSTVEN